MNKFHSRLSLPTKPQRLPLEAEILWGCEAGGNHHFPRNMESITTRYNSSNPKPLSAFSRAVMDAVDRVWIIDEYFLVPERDVSPDDRILTILDWLHERLVASDIRILTKQHKKITEEMLQLFQLREQEINARQTRRPTRCSIQINTHLKAKFNFVHDRFAITDDELWHFGATVGGFHASVNAVSRGWSAIDSGAVDFFKLTWDECKK